MTAKLISHNDHVLAIYKPGEGNTLYVTFNSAAEKPRGLKFSGDSFFEKRNLPAIGIMSTSANWYPKAAMQSIVQAVRDVRRENKFDFVVTYGHSLGGYGALRFGADIEADVAIAFSPQISVDPAYTSQSNGFWDRIHPSLRGDMEIQANHLAKRNYVVFDPHDQPDRWAANRILAYPRTKSVIYPGAGHMTFTCLVSGRSVQPFISSLIDDDVNTARSCLRQSRSSSSFYHHQLSRAMTKAARHQTAAKIAARAVMLAPDEIKAIVCYASALRRNGQYKDAVTMLLDSQPMRDPTAYPQRVLLSRLVLDGEIEMACNLVRSALTIPGVLIVGQAVQSALLDAGDVDRFLREVTVEPPPPREVRDEWQAAAEILSKRKMHALAARVLGLVVSCDPKRFPVRMQMIRALKDAGQNALAIAAAEAAEKFPCTLQENRELAAIFKDLRHWTGVERVSSRILRDHPAFIEVRSLAIDACFALEMLTKVEYHLDKAAKRASARAGDLTAISQLASQLARAYEKDRSKATPLWPNSDPQVWWGFARDVAQRASALNPVSVVNHIVLAETQMAVDDRESANATIDHILTNLETTEAAHWMRMTHLLDRLGRKEDVVSTASRCLRGNRLDPWSKFLAARFLLSHGVRDEGMRALHSLSPSSFEGAQLSAFSELMRRHAVSKGLVPA